MWDGAGLQPGAQFPLALTEVTWAASSHPCDHAARQSGLARAVLLQPLVSLQKKNVLATSPGDQMPK